MVGFIELFEFFLQENVKVFLDHERWSEFMAVKSESSDGHIDTPFRLLIRFMPDMAGLVMSKCVEIDMLKDSKHPEFTVINAYSFSLAQDNVARANQL